MGIGKVTNVVGNDDVVCGFLRFLAVFYKLHTLLSKTILHKCSVFFSHFVVQRVYKS